MKKFEKLSNKGIRMVYVPKRQYEKYYGKTSGAIRRLPWLSWLKLIPCEDKGVQDRYLKELAEFLKNSKNIHYDEYLNLLSIIDRNFLNCNCSEVIVCLDKTLDYESFIKTLKSGLHGKIDFEQLSSGIKGVDIYTISKTP